MKKLFLFLLIISCKPDKQEAVKGIVNKSGFGSYGVRTVKEIYKTDETFYILAISPERLTPYIDIGFYDEYFIVRHIFKSSGGYHRMFYIVDYTNKNIPIKSNDPNDFFVPVAKSVLGDLGGYDFSGDYLIGNY